MRGRAGALDRCITLARAGEQIGTNAFNEPIYGPPVTVTRWASRRDVSDGERLAAGQVGSFLLTRFVVRADPQTRTVSPVWTLTHDGAQWNIQGVKETEDGRHRFIEITAARDAD